MAFVDICMCGGRGFDGLFSFVGCITDVFVKCFIEKFIAVYIYGTVESHKTEFPLKPIIPQIPTSIYSTAKILNKLIIPYIPAKYQINPTDQFLDIIRENFNVIKRWVIIHKFPARNDHRNHMWCSLQTR